MSGPQESTLWYRVANLRAQLREHVRVHRHSYRGQRWYILRDGASSRHFRFGPGTYAILRLLDGQRTIDEIYAAVTAELGDDTPTQDEVVSLLVSLHASDLVQCDEPPDAEELFSRYQRAQSSRWKQHLRAPLLIRVPLFDPERHLDQWAGIGRTVFGPVGLLAWLAVVAIAAALASAWWPQIDAYWAERALAPYNLALLAAVYPVVKGVHELAHALAVKRWGGEVHETGVMFLLFMPLPYVDASSASAFPDKRHRMWVGAAGIAAELFLASVALFVWMSVETGMVRDIAYDVMLIGGISTLLFNGNPLLRFDGYYVLADAVEIPNLAPRSVRYYGYLAQRYLFGIAEARSPVSAPGERGWFVGYGVAAYVYRIAIMVTVTLFVAEHHLVAGAVVAALLLFGQVVRPLARHAAFVARSPLLRRTRGRAFVVAAAAVAAVAVAVFVVPVPSSTRTQGVVWLPDDAQVRAGAEGFVTRMLTPANARVEPDHPLVQIADPLVDAHVRVLEWESRELTARRDASFLEDRVATASLEVDLRRALADLGQARQDAGELTVRSAAAGQFMVPGGKHLTGRFVSKGDVIGYVSDLASPIVRVVVGQDEADLVRRATRGVHIRLADAAQTELSGSVEREVPSATNRLPSRALGTTGGGPIAVDPEDSEGVTAVDKFFLFDVALPATVGAARIGTRAYLRFDHGREPLATQWYRGLRQLFLRRLSV